MNELNSRPSSTYTYDSNGNTTSKTDSTGTTNYTWDFENRLTTVTLAGSGGAVYFKYDPFGRRIYKQSPTATSIFAYDGDNLVETVNASGGVVARYTQGLNIDEPLAELRGATTDYYEADGLGSITSLTDTTGAPAATYTCDSFGNTVASIGTLRNYFRYTGREFDTETSLYYYRARYYDAAIGRFISEDPLGLRLGTNLRLYVGNNPERFVDPSGLCQVSVGHHPVATLVLTCGSPINIDHTYIVLGGKNKDGFVFDAGPDGPLCPWCKPKIAAAAGPLAPGLPETATVMNDPLEVVTQDDGRPCEQDQRILDALANAINAAGIPYRLLGTNSNSVTSTGLSALAGR